MAEKEVTEFPEHVHKAFEAALVACMDYFRGVWDTKDREIAALKKRLDECESELARVKRAAVGREGLIR